MRYVLWLIPMVMVSSVAAQGLENNPTSSSSKCPNPLFECIGPGNGGGGGGTPPPIGGTPPWPRFIVVEPQLKKPFYGLATDDEITFVPGSPPLAKKLTEAISNSMKEISSEKMYLFEESIEKNGKNYEYIIVPGSSLLK